jgi:hypothetical protein
MGVVEVCMVVGDVVMRKLAPAAAVPEDGLAVSRDAID